MARTVNLFGSNRLGRLVEPPKTFVFLRRWGKLPFIKMRLDAFNKRLPPVTKKGVFVPRR